MPRLSDSMEEGTIVSWLLSDGDAVTRGDELVEIETDKATMVYESDLSGVVTILVPEKKTVPVGAAIASIEAPASQASNGDAEAATNTGEDGVSLRSGLRRPACDRSGRGSRSRSVAGRAPPCTFARREHHVCTRKRAWRPDPESRCAPAFARSPCSSIGAQPGERAFPRWSSHR